METQASTPHAQVTALGCRTVGNEQSNRRDGLAKELRWVIIDPIGFVLEAHAVRGFLAAKH